MIWKLAEKERTFCGLNVEIYFESIKSFGQPTKESEMFLDIFVDFGETVSFEKISLKERKKL